MFTADLDMPLDALLTENIAAAERIVMRVRPETLHAASDYENALLALALGAAFHLPVVYEVRGFWEETWLSKRDERRGVEADRYLLRRDRELECMHRADAVVTLSEIMREQIIERGIEPNKVSVVPNAVDTDAFPVIERDNTFAATLGIRKQDLTIGYISSFSKYEGIRYLVDATARLAARGVPVKCLLIGDGEEYQALERQVRQLGVKDRVILTGRVPHDEVLRYYGLIDVFVVPRTNDRVCHLVTPLKPYEAMATGRALVVSRTRALATLVDEGRTGMTFAPEDPDDLADVLENLLMNPDRRHSLGARARDWVSGERTWDANAARYEKIYSTLSV